MVGSGIGIVLSSVVRVVRRKCSQTERRQQFRLDDLDNRALFFGRQEAVASGDGKYLVRADRSVFPVVIDAIVEAA